MAENAFAEETFQRLSWRRLTPFGVELDCDLAQPLSEVEQRCLRALFYRHGLILTRSQRLSLEAHRRVAGYLGPLIPEEGESPLLATDGKLGNEEFSFHSDFSFTCEPYLGISLHALDVVEGESYTNFVSGVRAYAKLPDALKQRIAGLQLQSAMLHRQLGPEEPVPAHWPQHVREVAPLHPVTDEPILMVVEQHAVRIRDLPPQESADLLRELAQHIFAPDNLFRHHWRNGDVVFWDNLALQHARPKLQHVKRRVLQRACIGTKTFAQLWPDFRLEPDEVANFRLLKDSSTGRWAPDSVR